MSTFYAILDQHGAIISIALLAVMIASIIVAGRILKKIEQKNYCADCGAEVPSYYYNFDTKRCLKCQHRANMQEAAV